MAKALIAAKRKRTKNPNNATPTREWNPFAINYPRTKGYHSPITCQIFLWFNEIIFELSFYFEAL